MDNFLPSNFSTSTDLEQILEDDLHFAYLLNDCSSANVHRRSVSDSLAFLDNSSWMNTDLSHGENIDAFEGQSSQPSMLTDLPLENSVVQTELQHGKPAKDGPDVHPDPKKLKRIANNEAAQRSRIKKQQYLENLEKRCALLKALIVDLNEQVHSQQVERANLQNQRKELCDRAKYFEAVRAFKQAEFDTMLKEKDMLSLINQLKQGGNI